MANGIGLNTSFVGNGSPLLPDPNAGGFSSRSPQDRLLQDTFTPSSSLSRALDLYTASGSPRGDQISKWDKAKVQSLSADQIAGLGGLIVYFRPQQLSWLLPGQVQAITADQFNALSKNQVVEVPYFDTLDSAGDYWLKLAA